MNSNLKNFLFKFFFIYRVGYKAEKKSGLWKKSKVAHNFFVTKAPDLKNYNLKALKECT